MALRPIVRFRPLAASVVLALTLALAACGGDADNGDDAESSAGAGAPTTTDGSQTAATKPASDKGQIKALVARGQKAFADGDGATICADLSERGQRDLVDFGHATGLRGDCPAVATAMVKRERAMGTAKITPKILSLRVGDSQAVALFRVAAGAPTLRQRYLKEGGEWKVDSYNLAPTVGAGGSS